ncbi:MAG: nucleoside hydrolase [Acidobacteria bacterium]|nr:nucleoside hydrolase [Acidobacteriota bacterium]
MIRLPAILLLALMASASSVGCRRDTPARTDGRTAVWLDVSPSFGDPPRNPADAFALVQAFGSGQLAVRGVSITYGNVPLVRGFPAAQELLKRLDTGLLRPWRGPSSPEERAAPTEATELLREALTATPLTIVAAGPATTLASTLRRDGTLASRIERLILVAGQSADAIGQTPLDDVNVTADVESLRIVLDSAVPITLIAPALGAAIGLDRSDLDRLDTGSGAVRLITPSAGLWLHAQTEQHGASTLAVGAMAAVDVAAHPGHLRCESATARLSGDSPATARLLVSSTTAPGSRPVTWCHTADAEAKNRIIADALAASAARH